MMTGCESAGPSRRCFNSSLVMRGTATPVLSSPAARSVNQPRSLRSRTVRMLMGLRVVHDPSLRTSPADEAFEEDRASIARDAVVVAGHVASDPVPHMSLQKKRLH